VELDVATTSLKFYENELTTSVTKLMMKIVFLATYFTYKNNSRKTHFEEALLGAGLSKINLNLRWKLLENIQKISLILETNIKIFKK
jgi:hypothetical protein